MKNKLFIIVGLFTWLSTAVAEEHDHDHAEVISEVEMSEAAIARYGIQTKSVSGTNIVTLPRGGFVVSRDEYFVYTHDDEHFQELEIHPVSITAAGISFENETSAKNFVVDGAKYLRMVFLNGNSPESGHSH